VHLYDPHEPYAPPEEFRRRAPTPYAGEVMYADAQVARLLDGLDALGLRRRSLIAYLSDHGESLGEHGEPTHGIFVYGSTLDVPLIIAPPLEGTIGVPPLALPGRHVRGLARLVDVTPTVLDLVGLPVPAGLDGVSLLPLVASEGASPAIAPTVDATDAIAGPVSYAETYYPRFHYGWSELVAMETTRWKFVRAPRPELYDILQDPRDARDVSAEYPRVAATLAQQLESMKLLNAGGSPTPSPIDPDAMARLRALGYVGSSDVPVRRTGPLPDPKDRVPLLQELLQAQADRDAGRLDEAARRLEALAHKDADNPAVFVALSSVYFRRNQHEAAIGAGKRAVALAPDSSVALLDLAFSYQAAGRVEEAAAGFERVLELDPGNLKAMVALGDSWQAKGDRQKAFALYERAVTLAPRFARAQVSLGILALEMNRTDVAEQALRQAAALGGDEPDLHFNLGVMAEQRGQREVAAREYQAELATHPENVGAWVNLGLLERQAGKTDAALSAFEHAASAGNDAMEGPYLMAETLEALGRREEAQRWATEALRRRPDDPRAQELLKRTR
jgi:tetratricopeptide (TPR) repeat protein